MGSLVPPPLTSPPSPPSLPSLQLTDLQPELSECVGGGRNLGGGGSWYFRPNIGEGWADLEAGPVLTGLKMAV